MDTWLARLVALQGASAYGPLFALLVSCGIGAPQRLAEFQGRVRRGGHAGPSSLAERIALWYGARKRSRQS